ncbi:MAG: DsbA family protein, partial [Gaiellales bacterium]
VGQTYGCRQSGDVGGGDMRVRASDAAVVAPVISSVGGSIWTALRCPACRLFATDYLPTVIDEQIRTGKAKYEFRLWPILGPDSVLAAQAAIAAQQQDRLFEYQDLWFVNQQDESKEYATDAYVDGVAQALGLNLEQFQADRQNETLWSPAIQDVQVIAAQNNFGGTPSFVIAGPGGEKVLTGGVPDPAAIAAAVDEVS